VTSNTNYLYKLNYINAPMLSLYLKEINQVKTGTVQNNMTTHNKVNS